MDEFFVIVYLIQEFKNIAHRIKKMAEKSPGNLLTKTNTILLLFLVVGFIISVSVYRFITQIESTNEKLIQNHLQTYSQLLSLRDVFSQQERILTYQYDSTQSQKLFDNTYQRSRLLFDGLKTYYQGQPELLSLSRNQEKIEELARTVILEKLVTIDEQQLMTATQQIHELIKSSEAFFEGLSNSIKERIEVSNVRIEHQLNYMRVLTLVYAVFLLVVAFLIIRSFRIYVGSSRLTERLAMFPHRSPNPIISLNTTNQITYANPATKRLLAKLNRPIEDISTLFPSDMVEIQNSILSSDKRFTCTKYDINDCTFECELHWLPDQHQWDLHLSDITAKQQAENKLQFQAYHNPETGIENQYKFAEVLGDWVNKGALFTHGQVEIRSFSRLLADGNDNKSLQVVSEVAAVLDKACHDINKDVQLFHVGDKNFAILIPADDCEITIGLLIDTIKTAMKETQFSSQHQVELDFGFACFPVNGKDQESIIRNTRIALDTSASQAHSDYVIFNHDLGTVTSRQNELHKAMANAFDEQKFQLYFQPQLALASNHIIGAEVLLRWQHEGQWISPNEFIPLAERSGFILKLGDWVLENACRKGKKIIDMGYQDFVVAVNISPKQFTAPNFMQTVEASLRKSQLAPQNLELEITEGVLFNNDTATVETLHQLKSMGVMLAIDDFGTGYSSLSYLKDFPIDKLKIDQSFVRNMHKDNADQSIVRSVIDLGNNLGLTLIAEGVEEQEQVTLLANMGCAEIQGFWFSKALDEEYFKYFLNKNQSVA